MLKIRFTSQMKKDLKLVKKQSNSGYDENEFKELINKLIHREPLEEKYKDHPLKGKFEGAREFHLGFDLVVVYEIPSYRIMINKLSPDTSYCLGLLFLSGIKKSGCSPSHVV